jgi:hypothetical protein
MRRSETIAAPECYPKYPRNAMLMASTPPRRGSLSAINSASTRRIGSPALILKSRREYA